MRLLVNWDADGDDGLDPNGEWVRITNLDPVNPLPLGGWWLRDSALRRLVFPSWAAVPPGGHITIYDGVGDDNESEFYWGLQRRGVRERHARRDRDGRRRVPVRPAGRPARLADLPVPRGAARTPTRARCAIDAKPRGKESVQITNTGAAPIDLEPYRLVVQALRLRVRARTRSSSRARRCACGSTSPTTRTAR